MSKREIKTRVKLEGEQEFRNAMYASADAVKALNAEEKLAKAQFEATGDAQQYAAERSRILKEKIEEQKKAVAAAEEAVRRLTEDGVDKNNKVMREWQDKLVTARTALVRMETQLRNTETEIKDQSSELNKAKTASDNAKRAIDLLNEQEKLAEAQFKATGDSEKYHADKAEILKKKIDEQKKVVAEAEAAIKSMADNGIDPNSAEMVEWKSKLTNAKTELTKLETQLNNTETEIKDQSSELGKAKTAMSNAESKMKSLTAEEKLAAAQFRETGDKEQYLADKTRIVKEKIEEQKKAVAAAEKAIKALTDNGVDPNSAEMVEWKTKLADARTGLVNLQTRLDNVGTEVDEETKKFSGAKDGADDLKSSVDKVAEGVDFQNLISGIDNITDHIEGVIKGAARAAKAVWDMGAGAGQWADNIATAANELGVDPETYQSWQYASRFIDTSVEDISKSWQDIQKKMKEGNTDYLASLAKMGIASLDSSGKVRESSAIFWDAIDYLHGISDASLQAEKATELFGNDWRKLNPLITAGSKAYKDLANEGRSVAVVSNENVAALGEVDDKIQNLGAQFDKLKYDSLAALAPIFSQTADALSKAVTAMDEFVQSEEGRAALDSLNKAVSGLISSFLGEDGGQGTFESIVNAAKGAVEGFTKAMEWLQDNGELVKDVIIGLGGAWAGLKTTKEVLMFMQLLKSTPLANIKALFGGGAASGAASAASGAAKAAGAGAGAVATQTTLLEKLLTVLSGGATKLAGGLVLGAYILLKPTETGNNDLYDENGNPTAEALSVGITSRADEAEEHIDWNARKAAAEAAEAAAKQAADLAKMTAAQGYWDAIRTNDPKETAKQYENLRKAYQGDSEGLNKLQDQIEALMLETSEWESLEDLPSDWFDAGAAAAEELEKAITEAQPKVDAAADATGDRAVDAADSALGDMYTVGKNAAYGLGDGIYAGADYAIGAADYMARAVGDAAANRLEVKSPSRVFARLGRYTGLGFAEGLDASTANVDRAMSRMMSAVTRPAAALELPRPALAAGQAAPRGAAPGAGGQQPVIQATIVMDKRVVGEMVAPVVNDTIGAVVAAERE